MKSCRGCRDAKLCGAYGLPGDCAVYCWVSGEKLMVDGEVTSATVGGIKMQDSSVNPLKMEK